MTLPFHWADNLTQTTITPLANRNREGKPGRVMPAPLLLSKQVLEAGRPAAALLSLVQVAVVEEILSVAAHREEASREQDSQEEVSLGEAAMATVPYWLILLLGVGILTAAPDIALFLPDLLM